MVAKRAETIKERATKYSTLEAINFLRNLSSRNTTEAPNEKVPNTTSLLIFTGSETGPTITMTVVKKSPNPRKFDIDFSSFRSIP